MAECTDEAAAVLSMAGKKARALNHEYVGTEHILMALADDIHGEQLLGGFGVDSRLVDSEVLGLISPGTRASETLEDLPLTPRARGAVQKASELAGIRKVGIRDILDALIADNDGVAGVVLQNMRMRIAEQAKDPILARIRNLEDRLKKIEQMIGD